MTNSAKRTLVTCVVCQKGKEIQHSLRLTKDEKGNWTTNPVCPSCRQALIGDAKIAGKFMPFFGLEASQREAAKRNDQKAINRPFLEKFGQKFELKKPAQATATVT
jgi:hypothetical protein